MKKINSQLASLAREINNFWMENDKLTTDGN